MGDWPLYVREMRGLGNIQYAREMRGLSIIQYVREMWELGIICQGIVGNGHYMSGNSGDWAL